MGILHNLAMEQIVQIVICCTSNTAIGNGLMVSDDRPSSSCSHVGELVIAKSINGLDEIPAVCPLQSFSPASEAHPTFL